MEASNGPEESNQAISSTQTLTDARSWEHPWSVDEIRKSAEQWSLAADVGLLEHMKDFASKLTAQAHNVSREVSQLLHDTRLTDAKIQSVTDYFLTLSDNQFIENRVYDEDDAVNEEKEEKPAAKNKTREEREAEMLPKLKEAVKIGLDVMEDAYDVLDVAVADSDSEDEDLTPTNEVILDPKDPYVTRPLPHLIGSHGFHQEDDVGVGDLLSGDEAESLGSLSESEDEIEKPPSVSDVSSSDYDSDDESDASSASSIAVQRKKASTLTSSDYTSSDDDAMFASKKKPASEDESSEDETVAQKKKRATSKSSQQREQGMFDQDDGDEDLFSGSGGLFGKTGGLFDAPKGGLFEGVDGFSDDESASEPEEQQPSEPVAQQPKPSKKAATAKKGPTGGVSLFGGAIKKGFFEGDKDTDDSVEEESAPVPLDTGGKSFFDDESSDEDDLFKEKPPPMKSKPSKPTPTSTPAKKASDLFDQSEDEDDLFDETSAEKTAPSKERATSEAKKPVGGVSMFGAGGGALQDAIRQRRATSSSSSASLQKSSNEVNSNPKNNESKTKSLFDGDSGDNLFAPPTVTSKVKKNNKNKAKVAKKPVKSELFGSSSDEDDLFFGSSASLQKSSLHSSAKSLESTASKKSLLGKGKAAKKPANPLFNDGDESLFAPKAQQPSSVKSSANPSKKSGSHTNLFNASDSDSDLFGSSTNKSSKIIQHDDSDDDDDDDGLFARKPPPVTTKTIKQPTKSGGLFGDSEEDSDVVPPPKKTPPTKKTPPAKKPAPVKKPTLFDESESDDDLFSGMSKAKPPAKVEAAVMEKKSNNKAAAKKTNKPAKKSKDLFGSDSDEDLFGSESATKTEKMETNITEKEASDEEEAAAEPPKKKLAGAVSMFGVGGGALLEAISKRRTESQKSNVSNITEKSVESAKPLADGGGSDDDLFGGGSLKTSGPSPSTNVSAKPFSAGAETKPVQKVKPPVSKVTPPISKVTSPVSKVTPPVSKVTPPVSKVTPPVSKVTPPVSKVTPPVSKVTPPVSKVTPPMSKVAPPVSNVASSSAKASNIGKLQANLSINPTALLPGAAPVIPHTTDVDAPLESVTKTRSRGQAGRRPPSRRGRRAAAVGRGDADSTTTSPLDASVETPPQPPGGVSPSTAESFASSAPVAKSDPPKDDYFLNDLLATPQSSSTKKKAAPKKAAIPDLFDDDLFDAPKPAKKKESKLPDEDIFNNAKPHKTSKPDTDLFGNDLGIEPEPSLFNETKKKSKKPKLFEDDLFADLDLVSSGKPKKKTEPIQNGDDDIDDIFAPKSTKTEKKKPKTNAIPTLDDDDLFGDSPTVTSSKGKSSKPTKDLFNDDDGDDLFGEAPVATKSKGKKKAVPTSIFDDDDIFSSMPTVEKPASKSTKKEKPSKTTSKKDSNPDLFDDPLSAILGQ